MKRYYLLIIILFFDGIGYSQNTSKIEEINTYYNSGLELINNKEYEKGLELITLGLQESENIKDKNLIGHGYFFISRYYQKKRLYQKAIAAVNKSLVIFNELNNKEKIYNCLYKLGDFYLNNDQYNKSLENFFAVLKIAETNNDEEKIALNLEGIGGVYLKTLDLKKARINFNKAITIFTRLGNEHSVMNNVINLGVSYQKEGDLIKAIDLYKVGLQSARKLNEKRIESIILGNLGSCNRRLGNFKVSLEYLFKALSIKKRKEIFANSAHTYNDISETYIEMNDFVKAKEFALKAIKTAKGNSLHQERYGYFILSNIEYDLGEYKNSRNNLIAYQKLEDSIFSIEKTKSINNLQIKYETEKKNLKIEVQESSIALLDSKNKITNQWLLFGGLGLSAVFFFITLFRSRSNVEKEKKQQEKFSQDLLMSQEEERIRIAKDLHDSVGQQLTLIKRKSQKLQHEEISIMANNALEEVRSISRNLYPVLLKQLGLTDSIEQLINSYDEQTDLFFSMDIDNINSFFKESTSLNFYRLIQECLTNIVKHAKAKSVTINIKKENNNIVTLISDNGLGFDVNDSKKKNSLGLKTIFERIKIMKGNLSIDSKLNNGTSFIFSIPIKNE
jgi:signal transduction histidine kinase